jgi:hypothetical protein
MVPGRGARFGMETRPIPASTSTGQGDPPRQPTAIRGLYPRCNHYATAHATGSVRDGEFGPDLTGLARSEEDAVAQDYDASNLVQFAAAPRRIRLPIHTGYADFRYLNFATSTRRCHRFRQRRGGGSLTCPPLNASFTARFDTSEAQDISRGGMRPNGPAPFPGVPVFLRSTGP